MKIIIRRRATEYVKTSCDNFVISQSASFSLIHCCLSDLGVTVVQGGPEPCTLLPSSAVFSGPLSVKKKKKLALLVFS